MFSVAYFPRLAGPSARNVLFSTRNVTGAAPANIPFRLFFRNKIIHRRPRAAQVFFHFLAFLALFGIFHFMLGSAAFLPTASDPVLTQNPKKAESLRNSDALMRVAVPQAPCPYRATNRLHKPINIALCHVRKSSRHFPHPCECCMPPINIVPLCQQSRIEPHF